MNINSKLKIFLILLSFVIILSLSFVSNAEENKELKVEMEYIYDIEQNIVTGIMHSNEKLKNTKKSWILSDDSLTYTTIFKSNGSYTTTVEDIYGNKSDILIEVTRD